MRARRTDRQRRLRLLVLGAGHQLPPRARALSWLALFASAALRASSARSASVRLVITGASYLGCRCLYAVPRVAPRGTARIPAPPAPLSAARTTRPRGDGRTGGGGNRRGAYDRDSVETDRLPAAHCSAHGLGDRTASRCRSVTATPWYVFGSHRPPRCGRDTASPAVHCRGLLVPSRLNRVRHRHCSDASRAAPPGGARKGRSPELVDLACRRRRHPVVSGAVSLLPPRASGPRCPSPHPNPGGACQALRGRATSITSVCPRTLALGTCRDRRSRVSPARSLFSSQGTPVAIQKAR